jgi:hypothetical protein
MRVGRGKQYLAAILAVSGNGMIDRWSDILARG